MGAPAVVGAGHAHHRQARHRAGPVGHPRARPQGLKRALEPALAGAIAATLACGGADDPPAGGTEATSVAASTGGGGETIASADSEGPGSVDSTGAIDPLTGAWQSRAQLAEGARQETGVAALDGELWVLGGFALGGGLVPRLEAYDPATDSWRTAAEYPDMLVHHANLAAANGRLWVLGSLRALTFDAVGDGWSYDPAADAWTPVAAMPEGTERGASGVAVLGDLVYVIGGLRSDQALDDAAVYDTTSDTWSQIPALPSARDHLVAAGVGGLVYAIGGRAAEIGSHVPDVDVFDPEAGTWSAGPPMPTSRAGMAAAVIGDLVFVAGGEGNPDDESGVFAELEVLDTTTNTWTTLDPMPTPRHGTGGAAIDGVFYVPGGADAAALAVVATHEAWVPG